jgi:hypothetical protein
MRIIGCLFAAMAVAVWWAPLATIAQSLVLALLAIFSFAFSSLMRRTRKPPES